MKKFASLVLILLLIAGIALAEGSISDYVAQQGFKATSAKNRTGTVGCYFTEAEKGADTLTWSDSKNTYTVTGKRSGNALKQLYLDLLAMADWEAGAYFIGENAQYAFNTPDVKSARTYKSLRTYTKAVTDHIGQLTAAPAASGSKAGRQTYVLNTSSKKFHLPDCASAAKIKSENRQEYKGSRDDLIAQGYDPCKHCNP